MITYTQEGSHTITKDPVAVTFSGIGTGVYVFTDVPDVITSISAKTNWNLRKRISFSTPASDGQYVASFTSSYQLPGGDLATPGSPNGDNVVNALDYAVLRGAWGPGSAGDISGDGSTNNTDYLILKGNWYQRGDVQ